jgi:hypothetical protein
VTAPSDDHWGEPVHARITIVTAQGHDLDRWQETITDQIAPKLTDPETRPAGFVRGVWLLDQPAGRAISLTLWRTRDALDAAEEVAAANRSQLTQINGVSLEVLRCEVVSDTEPTQR